MKLLTKTTFLISFEDIFNGSFAVHEIEPNFYDSTLSGFEYITDIIAQDSGRNEMIHDSNTTAVTSRAINTSMNHVNVTNLSACEADLVPVFGKPAEIIFILTSFRIEQ